MHLIHKILSMFSWDIYAMLTPALTTLALDWGFTRQSVTSSTDVLQGEASYNQEMWDPQIY